MTDSNTGAIFSKDRIYRYALWRIWNRHKPKVMFICLNPSTADEINNDPTLNRCISYSKSWNYGGVIITNLFAYRSTNPENLKYAKYPVGKKNDRWIKSFSKKSDKTVCAWGNNGKFLNRAEKVTKFFKKKYCIGVNKSGEPSHPLYQPKDLKLIRLAKD